MVNGLDFYPTILSWTGTKRPETQNLDGCDLSELLMKNPGNENLVVEKKRKATEFDDLAFSARSSPAIDFADRWLEVDLQLHAPKAPARALSVVRKLS